MQLALALATLAAAAASAAAAPVAAFDRFFVIILENQNYAKVIKNTYLGTTLRAKGRLLTNYKAIRHPSEPNYLAMISGSTQGVTDDGTYDFGGNTIVDLLEAKGVSWATYQENYPGNCFTDSSSDDSLYRRKHNPFISFTSISGDSARCAMIKDASQLSADIASESLAQYVFYTPNMDNDGHDTSLSTASNWVEGFIEPLIANPSLQNTLFLLTYDEDVSGSNQVYALLLNGGVTPGSSDSTAYTHYSQLATVEARWGLGNLGAGDASAKAFTIA
ncbi:hypothetical protein HK105_204953 [Polyrhizophydium stewartii]|uniref:Acid phosphatase n=1 Tax=Polyrhizophydium stewartii TaxID=2732419 RepID=A0ABR4N7Q0_9FUNG